MNSSLIKSRRVKSTMPSDIRVEIIRGADFDIGSLNMDSREKPSTRKFTVYNYQNPETRRKIKVLECTTCGTVYRKWHNFFDHLRVHTKERPFKCLEEGCDFAFT